MHRILLSITALFASLCLMLLGNGLLSTLLVIRGVDAGFSEQLLGFMSSSYFLGALIGTQFSGKLIVRMGHIRTFTFTASLLACAALLYAFFLDPWAWLVLRLITGFSIFVMFTVIESWLNGQTSEEYRNRIFSVYMLVNLIAIALSQQLLNLDDGQLFTLFALVAVLASAAVLPISWTRLEQPAIALDMPQIAPWKLYDAAPIAVIGVFCSGIIMGPFWGLTPLFATSLGFSDSELANFITLSILGGAVLQYPVGLMSDARDRRQVTLMTLVAAMVLAILMSIAVHLNQTSLWVLTPLSMLFCGLVLALYPIGIAHMVDRIHRDHLVAGTSGLLLIYGLGAFVSPGIAGFFLQKFGGQALPEFYILSLALFTGWVGLQLARSKVVEMPEDHESHYIAMVRTSPNVMMMHPDSEEEIEPEPSWENHSEPPEGKSEPETIER